MYLCDIYSKNGSFALQDPVKRAKVMNRLCFNCWILFRRDADVMKDIFWFGLQDLKSTEHYERIVEGYGLLEIYLGTTEFVALDEMSIADFSVVATLSTLDLLLPVDQEKFPKLGIWFEKMKTLPYYRTANQKGLDDLKRKLASKSKFVFQN